MTKKQVSLDNTTRVANQTSKSGFSYKRFSWLLAVLLLISTVAGYFYLNRDQGPVTLKIASGPYRSDSYELMKEVVDVVSRHSEELIIEVVPSKDSSNNISMLNRGVVDLATIRSNTPVVSNVRMVADLFSDYFQLITRSESLIYSPTDLIGKKVAIANFGTDEFRSFWALGDHYDLPINGVLCRLSKVQKHCYPVKLMRFLRYVLLEIVFCLICLQVLN